MPENPAFFENTTRLSYVRKQSPDVSHVTQARSAISADASVAPVQDVAEGGPLMSLTGRSFLRTAAGHEQILDFLKMPHTPLISSIPWTSL